MMIYVGNLDYAVSSDELRAIFEPFGAVTLSEVQVKSRTGQSRGFGLVEMPNDDEGPPRPTRSTAATCAIAR